MFKRIFRAIFASTTLVLLVSVALSALSLSIDFDNTEVRTLTSQADLAAAGVNAGGVFKGIAGRELSGHLDRPERQGPFRQ